MKNRITLHICSRDRHSELYGLLGSLRGQTYQNFDIVLLDDASGMPVTQCMFLGAIINRMKLEAHNFKIIRNEISFGCCHARNKCIEEDVFGNPLVCRLDDDIILNNDYLEKLVDTINKGYDIASGCIPLVTQPEIIRENKYVRPIINEHKFDANGLLVEMKDECGFCYLDEEIIPTNQFRTNALYKSEIHKTVRYPENLTSVAFREEGFFSFKAIINGFKIGINTGAVAYHLQTPSGGNRRKDYPECVKIDNQTFVEWCKKQYDKHGDFLKSYKEMIVNESSK